MSTREGNLEAPTRHALDWKNPQFYDQDACFTEMERVFDVCHGCRRCVSLCQSFPTLFDLVDATEDGEVHPGEGVEEKISLSERFGLWVSFYPFTQAEYLTIVAQWLTWFGVAPAAIAAARPEALVWALERASRSGRVAYQFARDYAGSHADSA